jgi:hypothetical protein
MQGFGAEQGEMGEMVGDVHSQRSTVHGNAGIYCGRWTVNPDASGKLWTLTWASFFKKNRTASAVWIANNFKPSFYERTPGNFSF